MSNSLFITNLASNTTKVELWKLFTKVGRVRSLQLEADPRSAARNQYSFIEMETPALMKTAIEQLDFHLLHKRRISVVELQAAA